MMCSNARLYSQVSARRTINALVIKKRMGDRGDGGQGARGGNPGVKGLGSPWEAGEERAENGIPKVAGTGRNIKKTQHCGRGGNQEYKVREAGTIEYRCIDSPAPPPPPPPHPYILLVTKVVVILTISSL